MTGWMCEDENIHSTPSLFCQALVMVFLFRKGSIQEKLRDIIKLTYEHTRNLAIFVGTYKSVLGMLRGVYTIAGLPMDDPSVGKPAVGWHAAVAGALGGYWVWSRYSGVNYQIVMYLFSRIMIAMVKHLAARGIKPFCQFKFAQVYPTFAIAVWSIVMWLFEKHPETLHPSLKASMEFL